MKYVYDTVSLTFSIWSGRANSDYLDIINQKGEQGWKFVCFAPTYARPKGVKGVELLFEKAIPTDV